MMGCTRQQSKQTLCITTTWWREYLSSFSLSFILSWELYAQRYVWKQNIFFPFWNCVWVNIRVVHVVFTRTFSLCEIFQFKIFLRVVTGNFFLQWKKKFIASKIFRSTFIFLWERKLHDGIELKYCDKNPKPIFTASSTMAAGAWQKSEMSKQ